MVIGRLYVGKRNIIIQYNDNAAAKARLEEYATAAAGRSPGNIEFTVSGVLNRRIVIADKYPVPLAFVPAFVPAPPSGDYRSKPPNPNIVNPDGTAQSVDWVPYNGIPVPFQRETVDQISKNVRNAWSWQD